MVEQQLDLFSDAGPERERPLRHGVGPPLVVAEMDDDALIAAIPESSLADTVALAAEAGRRQLAAAVPALAALCRRFAGFGIGRAVPEQAASLRALMAIGGRDAAHEISRMIERGLVQGPTLQIAVNAAARLHSALSADVLAALLRNAEPGIRADACRCARPIPELIVVLVDLVDDLDPTVARSAACALGQMGRVEARSMLKRLLRDKPTEDVIDAVSSIADEECLVFLGRIARSMPALAAAVIDSLDSIDHPRVRSIVAGIKRQWANTTASIL
jgi:hypothetical protein